MQHLMHRSYGVDSPEQTESLLRIAETLVYLCEIKVGAFQQILSFQIAETAALARA